MRGFRHRAVDVETENRFGSSCPNFCEAAPDRIAGTRRGVSAEAVANEIDVDVVVSLWANNAGSPPGTPTSRAAVRVSGSMPAETRSRDRYRRALPCARRGARSATPRLRGVSNTCAGSGAAQLPQATYFDPPHRLAAPEGSMWAFVRPSSRCRCIDERPGRSYSHAAIEV